MGNKFKAGQQVLRINEDFVSAKVGNVYTVAAIYSSRAITLVGHGARSFDPTNFKAVENVEVLQEPTPQELLSAVLNIRAEYEASLTIRNDARRAVDAAEKATDILYGKLVTARSNLSKFIN